MHGPCVHSFFPDVMHRAYGEDRLSAALSAIAPRTRTRRLAASNHWGDAMCARNASPWITRSSPDLDGELIDFVLCKALILGTAENAIRRKLHSLRFFHNSGITPTYARTPSWAPYVSGSVVWSILRIRISVYWKMAEGATTVNCDKGYV